MKNKTASVLGQKDRNLHWSCQGTAIENTAWPLEAEVTAIWP